MNEIRCPECKRLLGKILFEGQTLAIEIKCPRCDYFVDYNASTHGSKTHNTLA